LVFAVRQAVRGVASLVETAVNSASPGTKPRIANRRFDVLAESRLRKISGGHNERF
jgi:hypothetical protein